MSMVHSGSSVLAVILHVLDDEGDAELGELGQQVADFFLIHREGGILVVKYKYGNRHFWCRGYYVDTVGKYEGAIKDYIRNQLQDDIANDQLSLKEFVDPFTGEEAKKA